MCWILSQDSITQIYLFCDVTILNSNQTRSNYSWNVISKSTIGQQLITTLHIYNSQEKKKDSLACVRKKKIPAPKITTWISFYTTWNQR